MDKTLQTKMMDAIRFHTTGTPLRDAEEIAAFCITSIVPPWTNITTYILLDNNGNLGPSPNAITQVRDMGNHVGYYVKHCTWCLVTTGCSFLYKDIPVKFDNMFCTERNIAIESAEGVKSQQGFLPGDICYSILNIEKLTSLCTLIDTSKQTTTLQQLGILTIINPLSKQNQKKIKGAIACTLL